MTVNTLEIVPQVKQGIDPWITFLKKVLDLELPPIATEFIQDYDLIRKRDA
jgi:hypothetical protein